MSLATPSRSDLSPFPPPDGLKDIIARFGDPARHLRPDGTIGTSWELEILDRLALPYPLELAWAPGKTINSLRVHRLLVPVFERTFAEIAAAGLADQARWFGGGFAVRRKRTGGTALSTHSWGIAIDLNPVSNRLGTAGNMHPDLVALFEAHGFAWGGRFRPTPDPMHFQYCTGY